MLRSGDTEKIGEPLVTRNARPRYTLKVASVTINDGKRPYVLRKPLIKPRPAPSTRMSSIPTGKGSPSFLTRMASTQVVRATLEPGDKSIPPVKMTRVEPMAIMATTATSRARFLMLPGSRKRLVVRLIIITASSRDATGPATVERRPLATLFMFDRPSGDRPQQDLPRRPPPPMRAPAVDTRLTGRLRQCAGCVHRAPRPRGRSSPGAQHNRS